MALINNIISLISTITRSLTGSMNPRCLIINFKIISQNYRTSMNGMDIVERLNCFMENEARSCSMDFGCITPQYVYRMWGGIVSLEEIETALKEIKNGCR